MVLSRNWHHEIVRAAVVVTLLTDVLFLGSLLNPVSPHFGWGLVIALCAGATVGVLWPTRRTKSNFARYYFTNTSIAVCLMIGFYVGFGGTIGGLVSLGIPHYLPAAVTRAMRYRLLFLGCTFFALNLAVYTWLNSYLEPTALQPFPARNDGS